VFDPVHPDVSDSGRRQVNSKEMFTNLERNARRFFLTTLSTKCIDDVVNTAMPQIRSDSQRICSACNGRHNVEKCRNLFEELRPDGWVVHEPQEHRCQQYLKTAEGRALYDEQKKHHTAHLPEKTSLEPASKKRKATEDPESPQLSSV
jgi:hypothetical protein